MKQRLFLIGILVSFLILFLAAPVLAATCPSDCSCLLPAEAKKLGYSGYCNGKQAVCGYDKLQNEKYCYEKTVTTTVPPLVTATKPVVTTVSTTIPTVTTAATTVPQFPCPYGCLCLSPADGKAKGLAYCGGKQTTCSRDISGAALYCFSGPVTTMATTPAPVATPAPVTSARLPGITVTVTTTRSMATPVPAGAAATMVPAVIMTTTLAVPAKCPEGCSCLDERTISDRGYPFCGGQKTECGFSKTAGVLFCAQAKETSAGISPPESATTGQEPDIIASIGIFITSLFAGSPGTEAPSDSIIPGESRLVVTSYCRERFGLDECDWQCVNKSTDPENCGGCGLWCRQASFSGQMCCSGTCVGINSDPDNCGGCGNACPEGAPCIDGYCSALGCMDSRLTECGRSCVDTLYSESDCGECGNACPDGQRCISGTCDTCFNEGFIFCVASGCTDISSDRMNCGRCQHTCTDLEVCMDGECGVCADGTTKCWNRCVDLMTDWNSCGECGNYCGRSQTCIAGACTCPEGSTTCGTSCVDLRTNDNHCGRCGRDCPAGTSCNNGVCQCYRHDEGMRYCDGRCIDTTDDRDNCGRCGNDCSERRPDCRDGRCCVSAFGECY